MRCGRMSESPAEPVMNRIEHIDRLACARADLRVRDRLRTGVFTRLFTRVRDRVFSPVYYPVRNRVWGQVIARRDS